MTPADLRATLDALGLSQLGAARLLDVNGRTVRRWVAGEAEIPHAVGILFGIMAKHRERPDDWAPRARVTSDSASP